MSPRSTHRFFGILLVLPLCGWIATGAIFLLKPGYEGAYDVPSVQTYPLAALAPAPLPKGTLEARQLRTILGDHLLVHTSGGWSHLDPATMRPRAEPSAIDATKLIEDAIRAKRHRYGDVVSMKGLTARTTTGVTVTLDWSSMSLQQRGPDTDRIDLFYRIHYLQWTGVKVIDRALAILGLTFLFALTALGVRIAFRREG